MTTAPGTLGILNPHGGLARFELARVEPAAELAALVERHWIVRWDLGDGPAFEQETLPHPSVHLAFEPGRAAVHGVGTRRHVARLVGAGRVLGTKFKPGGFLPFTALPIAALTDRVLPIDEVFGAPGLALARRVFACADDHAAVGLVEGFLRGFAARIEPSTTLATALVRLAQADRSIATAEDLARAGGLPLRSLHRLFARQVGVGPKWVIRRARVQEAAERVAAGERVDWAGLAQELGYHDQAHLIRDFKAQIGRTPAAYGAQCARAAAARAAPP